MNHPKSAIGSRRVVETSLVVWMDLLGYGSMLRSVAFDPTEEESQRAIERLGIFQDCVAKHSNKLLPSVVMNDGVALYRDLSPRAKSVTFEFLSSSWELFKEINEIEYAEGYPGVRAVLASGFRVRRKSSRPNHLIDGIGQHILQKVESGEISNKQAIYNALTIRPTFELTPELQANFAFSKAYLAESSGTKGGFKGSNFFVDKSIFDKRLPKWLSSGESVKWQTEGMEADFIPILNIDFEEANRSNQEGVLDAFQVAENISASSEIVDRLKKLTINKELSEDA